MDVKAARAPAAAAGAPPFLAGGGEMGALIRAHDWAATPLGRHERWPRPLRGALRLVLASSHPMLILWGPAHIPLCNDAFAAALGPGRQPAPLGRSARECWPEAWGLIGPQVGHVIAGRGAARRDALPAPPSAEGGDAHPWWTAAYGPIHDEDDDAAPGAPGPVGGVLVVANDATREREALRASEGRLRVALDAAGVVGIYDWDIPGRRLYADAPFAELYGVDPEAAAAGTEPTDFGRRIHPDDLPAMDAALRRAMATGEPYEAEYRLLQPGGAAPRWVQARGRCRRDPATGRPLRFAGVVVDATARRRAEEALRDSEERLRIALAAGRLGTWELDLRAGVLTASEVCRADFGLPPGVPIGLEDLRAAIHPEDRARVDAAIARSVAERTDYEVEYRVVRADGSARWVQARGRPAFGPDGAPLRLVGVSLDVTARREAQARQALLAREVDHRAKNALAVVQAALRLTRAPDLASYRRAVEGRVGALARAQALLTEDRRSGAELRALLRGELAPFLGGDGAGMADQGGGAAPRAELSGPAVALPRGVAQPLAMAVHELATNAVKHGALSAPGGRVAVAWRVDGAEGPGAAGRLHLRWTESGGPPAEAPSRPGFGTRVLDGTVRAQLGGAVALEWREAGLACTIEVPLSRPGAAGGAAATAGVAAEGSGRGR